MSAQDASTKKKPKRKFFMPQANMRRMCYALTPVALSAVYFFGWRVMAILAVVTAAGLATEYLMATRRGKPVSTACLVSCMLFALSLPPTVPVGVAIVGIVVGILFGKEVFGGFGRNFVNPAILGRAFVYICFPVALTGQFVPAFQGVPGGFAEWSFERRSALPAELTSGGESVADAVSQASPMWINKEHGPEVSAQATSLSQMYLGNISGLFEVNDNTRIVSAGSMGEGCTVLILLAGVYLLATKTANWRLMLSCLAGLAAATWLFRYGLGYNNLAAAGQYRYIVPPLHFTLAAGTTAYVMVFMVTDPVSATKRPGAQLVYGFIIGFFVVFLRWRGVFVAAATFSVLLGNIIGPQLDMAADAWKDRKKRRAESMQPQPQEQKA